MKKVYVEATITTVPSDWGTKSDVLFQSRSGNIDALNAFLIKHKLLIHSHKGDGCYYLRSSKKGSGERLKEIELWIDLAIQ